MKQRKLAPLLAVTISLEMILTPVAFAQNKEKKTGVNEVVHGLLGAASGLYEKFRPQNQGMHPQVAQDLAAFNKQQQPLPDKYFNGQKLSQIPGLGQYLAINGINPNSLNCVTLPTNLYEAHNEVCRIGVTGDKGNPLAQIAEAQAYSQQYGAIDKMYRNFSSESNVGGELFGVGCMKNAMQVLNGFFKYRLDELDKLVTNVEALQASFKEASKADLDAIEESTAILNGGETELANKVKSRRPDLFDYAKRFNNPACNSMLGKEEFNNLGKGGLNAINKQLQDTATEKVGEMGFSGESYSRSHSDILSDINNLAEKVGKQAELNADNGLNSLLKDMPGLVSSPNGLNKAIGGDFFIDVASKFSEGRNKLEAARSEVEAELGAEAASISKLAATTQNDGSFEAQLSKLEIKLKNDCLARQANVDEVLGRMYNPSASGFANKNASNFMRDKLKQIMEDPDSSFEKKMTELKSVESQQGARYYVRMENSYEVQEVGSDGKISKRVVEASTARTPSVFFADVIKSCDAQYKVNSKGGKMSQGQAIQKLRQLKQDYKTQAKANAKTMKDEIRRKLISCDSPAKANNTVPGSCTPNSFDTSKPGFCADAAFSCSKNMQACSKQAEKFVTDIKTERAARVTNYKIMVDKNKRDIIKLFDTALSRYMKDGELIRGAFGAGFSSPSGIERDVPEGQRHLAIFKEATSGSPDGALLLEDPEKFTQMFKANIGSLKKSVEEQQQQILGGSLGNNSGLLAKHIEDTKAKYTKVASEAARFHKDCQKAHDSYVSEMEGQRKQQAAEMGKQQSELGQKNSEFCRKYSMAQDHPGPACSGNISDLTAAAVASGGADYASKFEAVCASYNNESKGGSVVDKALALCPPKSKGNPTPVDTVVVEAKENYDKKKKAREDLENEKTVVKAEQAETDIKDQIELIEADIQAFSDKEAEPLKKEAEQLKKEAEQLKKKLKARLAQATRKVGEAKQALAEAKKAEGEAKQAWEGTKKPKPAKSGEDKKEDENNKLTEEDIANCEELLDCMDPEETTDPDTGKTKKKSCDTKYENSIASKIVKARGQELTLDSEDMPAFCSAGNGSMGPPKNFFDSLQQGLKQATAGGAIGQ